MAGSTHIEVIRHDSIIVVRVLDTQLLDEQSIQEVSSEIIEAIQNATPPLLILDFSHVQFLSSAALGMLLKLRQDVKQVSGQVHLAGIRPEVMEVFKITRLDGLFQFHPDADEAVAKVQTWLRLMGGENAARRSGRL